jgi:hypothetical protein
VSIHVPWEIVFTRKGLLTFRERLKVSASSRESGERLTG